MRTLTGIGLLLLQTCAWGQSPLAFEVASVKPAPPPSDPHRISSRMSTDKGRLAYTNVTLRDVMAHAYQVKDNQISGPDWLSSERYDISAKLPEGAAEKQIPEMLQTLLADRFKLTLHRETKVMPVYALVPAKGGPKLKESEEGKGGMHMTTGSKGRQLSGNVQLSAFADTLSHWLDRPVLDMTGLKGSYQLELEWSVDDNAASGKLGPPAEGKSVAEASDAPTIFTALQDKLGLKLEARKLPVEILTIDRADKMPTEN